MSNNPSDSDVLHNGGVVMQAVARRQRLQDGLFHRLTQLFSLLVLLALAGIIVSLFINAWPTFAKFGVRFLWYVEWDIINEEFGAAIAIVGRLAFGAGPTMPPCWASFVRLSPSGTPYSWRLSDWR